MDKVLRLKHWQIFLATFSAPLIFFFFLTNADNWDPILAFSPLLAIIFFGSQLTLLYVMATNLQTKHVSVETLEIRNYKIVLCVYLVYMTVMLLGMLGIKLIDYSEWKLVLDLISQGSYLYMVWYISKSLKTVEIKREAVFSEYVQTLLLLWLFPIGIWFIQPRINKIFVADAGH